MVASPPTAAPVTQLRVTLEDVSELLSAYRDYYSLSLAEKVTPSIAAVSFVVRPSLPSHRAHFDVFLCRSWLLRVAPSVCVVLGLSKDPMSSCAASCWTASTFCTSLAC